MYTAKTTLYLVDGKATATLPQGNPGNAQVYLVTGAVISNDEARRVGLLPPLETAGQPQETPAAQEDSAAQEAAPSAETPGKAAKSAKAQPSV